MTKVRELHTHSPSPRTGRRCQTSSGPALPPSHFSSASFLPSSERYLLQHCSCMQPQPPGLEVTIRRFLFAPWPNRDLGLSKFTISNPIQLEIPEKIDLNRRQPTFISLSPGTNANAKSRRLEGALSTSIQSLKPRESKPKDAKKRRKQAKKADSRSD